MIKVIIAIAISYRDNDSCYRRYRYLVRMRISGVLHVADRLLKIAVVSLVTALAVSVNCHY